MDEIFYLGKIFFLRSREKILLPQKKLSFFFPIKKIQISMLFLSAKVFMATSE